MPTDAPATLPAIGDPAPIKVGEPRAYDPIAMPDLIVTLGRYGKSRAQIAAHLGVTRRVLGEWEITHPKVAEALEVADTLALAWWESQGQIGIYLGGKEFNGAAWFNQIKARYPELYRDIQSHEFTGRDGGPIETKNVADADALRHVAEALNRALGRAKARAEAQTIEGNVIRLRRDDA